MRKATGRYMAGNPPASAAHALGNNENGDGAEKSDDRAERPNDAKPSPPEAQEDQRAEQPFRRAEEETGASNPKRWDQPEDQRAVADKRRNLMSFETKPLLVAKYVERENHRGANQAIVKIAPERRDLREIKDKCVHSVAPSLFYAPLNDPRWQRQAGPER